MHTLDEVLTNIRQSKIFAWDLECTSTTGKSKDALNPRLARPTLVAIASTETAGCWSADEATLAALVNLLRDQELFALVYNAMYDHKVLHYNNIIQHSSIRAKVLDVIGLAWLVDEEDRKDLKYAVKKFCGIRMTTYDDVVSKSSAAKYIKKAEAVYADRLRVYAKWCTAKVPKRPFPRWTDPLITAAALRKSLREKGATVQEAANYAADAFSADKLSEYREWIEQQQEKIADKLSAARQKVHEDMRVYATADAANLLVLYKKLKAIIDDEGTGHVIPYEMAVRLETIDMSIRGMPVDTQGLTRLQKELSELIETLESICYEHAGRTFNINSSKELQTVLFTELDAEIPVDKTIKNRFGIQKLPALTGAGEKLLADMFEESQRRLVINASDKQTIPVELLPYLQCDAKVLGRIAHPLAQAVLDYKTAKKLLSTYIDSTLAAIAESGIACLFSEFNCWGTKTGRFASKAPNLQNIPSRGKDDRFHKDLRKKGPQIRYVFIAGSDEVLIVADQSQIELRLIADAAEEPNLISVYHEGITFNGVKYYTGDIHALTAKKVGCSRKDAKPINFGFNYGMGPAKYAKQNRVLIPDTYNYDIKKCTDFRDKYFAGYPRIPALMDALEGMYQEGRRAFPTLAGRYRHFYSADRGLGKAPTKGTILNSCIQGSAADYLKYIIYIIRKYVYPRYPTLRLIGQVHDELIYLCGAHEAEEAAVLVKYVMEYPWFPLAVPVLASAKIAMSWGAKDDDRVPEIGTFYAEINGTPMLFTKHNWDAYLAADKAGLVTAKAACAQLTPEQITFCKSVVPDDTPKRRVKKKQVVLTRSQQIQAGLL